MKILHVIGTMDMGGAQSLLVELVPVQKKMGCDVTVLQLKNPKDDILAKKLTDDGVNVEVLNPTRPERSIMNVFALIPYLKKYDIVHVHLFPAQYWAAFAKLLSFSRTPIITTEHSTANKRRNSSIFKYVDTFIYKCYKEVVACSDKAKETFIDRYNGVNCISIPNGVNIEKYVSALPYSKKELLGIDEDTFVTTMVARFAYPKRQDVLVEALAKLPDRHHAVFVGGKKDDEGLLKVKKLAEKLGVSRRVHFLYSRPDVPRILKSSDAVLMSSEYEGLSLSSIEGMACGHPFIATDVNGLREVVSGAGILVECGNADDLANVLNKLATDKVHYNKTVERCLERASEFDITVVAEMYMNEYRKFLNK